MLSGPAWTGRSAMTFPPLRAARFATPPRHGRGLALVRVSPSPGGNNLTGAAGLRDCSAAFTVAVP
jgi:hypothetical protein